MANEEKNESRILSDDERAAALKESDARAAKKDYKPVTAQSAVAVHGPHGVEEAAAKRAKDAGVIDPAFVNYAEALENYQARPDVEPLDERRAREGGRDFQAAAFRREIGGTDNSGVTTSEDVATGAAEDNKDNNKTVAARKPSAK
ncbi:hypothetical protein SEA_ANNADREAMY_158 [Streptomyces phage Annadreamy]|uniref:Uncharacterized protein n=2 Tax=Annadreamyvirus annadreamy TaxID=2846392 RepID=A0A345GTH8_9CAUD|nr:hypothetical protein HWB75_gp113 [Streptomyces phage Annadreamy]AXG66250.1 hypothetical protein SEA_ANNADREAMY_158 [Streptomyces phage Annadreamy]QGH79473.1 hypothetical protein SEA_LIMPID_165 [Streptomyces phage Limpid]